MHFVIVGLSHKTCPLEIREKFSIPEDKIPQLLGGLLQNEDVQEGMLVSTCNRVEAYLVAKHIHRATVAVREFFSQWSGLIPSELEKYLYVKDSSQAIAHLFRVTASLDSLVVGEPQISNQIKEAYTQAVACQATGAYLNKLVHRSLHVAKKIRTETGIGQLPVSVSYAAVLLAEKIFGDLREIRVLLIGTGEMGGLAATHLVERHVGALYLSNRTEEKASEIAKTLGAMPIPFEEISSKLPAVDILIASSGGTEYLVGEAEVREAMRQRRNRPMFFIDISVPRMIEPSVNQIENVYLYDLDHLQGVVETNLREREKEAKRAEEIIASEVPSFLVTLNEMELSPTIRQLSKKFDLIRQGELEKYFARHPGLAPEEREALEVCTRAIVNKLLHEPIVLMKTEEARDGSPKYSEILRKLFKLEGER